MPRKALSPLIIIKNNLRSSQLLASAKQRQSDSSSSRQQQQQRQFHSIQDNNCHSWSVLNSLYQRQFKSAAGGASPAQSASVAATSVNSAGGPHKHYACLLLNITTDQAYKHLAERHMHIWQEASLKLAVDGSANCLARNKLIHTADVVCGDFDSIDPKLLEQLRCPSSPTLVEANKSKDNNKEASTAMMMTETKKKPQVIETPRQKETDFTKSLRLAMGMRPDIQNFMALYYFDGSRIDHLFGLVNTLHLIKKNIILVNIESNTISWLLTPGNHIIHKPKGGELCSLVPFTGPTEVKTQGLMYELGGPTNTTTMNFGGLISTSNICKTSTKSISVETNRLLLWSIDMKPLNKKPTN